jgi:hypothetical protein
VTGAIGAGGGDAEVGGFLKLARSCGDDSEGEPRFGHPHWGQFDAFGADAAVEDFVGVALCQLVVTDESLGVHGVEVPLRRVDDEVIVSPARRRESVQELLAVVENAAQLGDAAGYTRT